MTLFAKASTHIWRHERFEEAGEAASGYWLGVLTYIRDQEQDTPVIAFRNVGKPLNVGKERGERHCKRLVEVGLFALREDGYELLKYREQGNELKADVAARQEADRLRKAEAKLRKDSKRNPDSSPPDSDRNPNGIREEANGNPKGFPGSGSGSDLDLISGSLGGAGGAERGPEPPSPSPDLAESGTQPVAAPSARVVFATPDVVEACRMRFYAEPTDLDAVECEDWHRANCKPIPSPRDALIRWMSNKTRHEQTRKMREKIPLAASGGRRGAAPLQAALPPPPPNDLSKLPPGEENW
jgi:hypothetical protein